MKRKYCRYCKTELHPFVKGGVCYDCRQIYGHTCLAHPDTKCINADELGCCHANYPCPLDSFYE